ncbi:NUDIX domain protein [compost metagenome]
MPGGQVEEEESLIEAAIRETKEESGIDIEINKFCGVFQNVDRSICTTLFLGKAIGGEPATSSESLDVGFFSIEQAMDMLTWKNLRLRLEYCLNDDAQPFYVELRGTEVEKIIITHLS